MIMVFPDEVIRNNKQKGQSVPLRNIVRGPIEPTIPQLESWAVAHNGGSDANHILVHHGLDLRVNTCRRMIWLRIVGIFLDYKSRNRRILNVLSCLVGSPADAMHTRYSLDPIKLYVPKREVHEYNYRLDTMGITEIGESQAMMMMMFKDIYINNMENISTDIDRMHVDP